MATIRDVANLAGVSAGTVSNVLNRPSYVRADTRERVQAAIRELDFIPDQRSRQFRPGRTHTIGIAVAELENPFFVDVALGAEQVCRENELGVVICNSGYDVTQESQNLDLLVQQRVQGIIISPVNEASSRIESLKDRGVPMVFVDRVADDREIWSVVVDDREGGRLSSRHLISQGRHRIAFLGHPDRSPKVMLRYQGAREVINQSAGDITLEVVTTSSWTVAEGRRVGQLLAERPLDKTPTGVICANDMLALGLVQSLTKAGRRVPEDIAVIGYDDIEVASMGAVPLTTISQPRALLGQTAVEMMLQLINKEGPLPTANHIVLAPKLVIRESA